MSKSAKRLISVFSAFCLCFALIPATALAYASQSTGGGLAAASETGDATKYQVTVTASSFSDSGGTVTGGGEYAPGSQVTITATPDKTKGYCAAGWNLADIGEGVISPINLKTSHTFTMPEKSVGISITFEQHSFISYKNNGNGTHDVHCFYCNDVQTASETCVDAHSGGDGTTPKDGYCDKCSTRMPGVYFVELDPNGGTGTMESSIANSGENYTLPASGFTLDGHTFQGWATDSAATQAAYQPGATYTVNADTTFYAIWKSDVPTTYTITPSAEGGSYDASTNTLTIKSGGEVTFILNAGGRVYCEGDSAVQPTPVNGDASNATEWKAALPSSPGSYTFCYELNGQRAECTVVVELDILPMGYTLTLDYVNTPFGVTVGSGSKTVTGIAPGTVIDLSDYWPDNLTAAGSDGRTYYFAGFAGDDKGVVIRTATMDGDQTVYADWAVNEQFTVHLNPNGGALPYAKTRVSALLTVSDMDSYHQPVRSGYDFVGWSVDDDNSADSDDTQITGDCTLYAVWEEIHIVSSDWSHDTEQHWHDCSCGTKHDASDHVYYLGRANCGVCGYIQGFAIGAGGEHDARLQDGVAVVRGDGPISGTLDLGKTDAVAIRFTDASVNASAAQGTTANILYGGGTAAAVTGPGWTAAGSALRSGESLQIAVAKVGAGALPDSLTAPSGNVEVQGGPSYINVGGKQATFVGAVQVDVKAVNASGVARAVALKSDKSDAFAWSTTLKASELAPLTGNVGTDKAIAGMSAYKVLADGGLEAKGIKVTQNPDGTLTLSASSNGNSTYLFVYEPEAQEAGGGAAIPQTGDSNMVAVAVLVGIALAALTALVVVRRKMAK